jgi:Lon protease-like protein
MSSPLPDIAIPDRLPVMVLPCTLFPHCLQPLFIFEPRYRAMLAEALAAERMFCIGTRDPDDETSPVAPISTAGLVRACVTHENGTSHLLLLGLRRVRLVDWAQEEPFRIARVEPIDCEMEETEHALRVAGELIEMTLNLSGPGQLISQQIHENLSQKATPSAAADILAHHFVRDPRERQRLLETLDVVERMHCLRQSLQEMLTGGES